jgi:hypothetical protein
MANPLLIMALLAAASAGAHYAGQRKEDKARAVALAEDRARRLATQKETSEKAQDTLALFTKSAKEDEAAKAKELEAAYTGIQEPLNAQGQTVSPAMLDVIAPTGSTQTIAAEGEARSKARTYTNELAKQRANLSAFGDVMLGKNIIAGRTGQDIAQRNADIENWERYVLPAQLQAANQRGRGWHTLGDVLQLVSAIYAPYGLAASSATKGAQLAATGLTQFGPYMSQTTSTPGGTTTYWG